MTRPRLALAVLAIGAVGLWGYTAALVVRAHARAAWGDLRARAEECGRDLAEVFGRGA